MWQWHVVWKVRHHATWIAAPPLPRGRREQDGTNNMIARSLSNYDSARAGNWKDVANAMRPRASFVATCGADFDECTVRREWFPAWESALAATTSIVSAIASSGDMSLSCSQLQMAGGALQMCGLAVVAATRPHKTARAWLLAVALEGLGFFGGLCLLVAAAIDDGAAASGGSGDSSTASETEWNDAASVILQVQFYVSAALLVADGMHSGRVLQHCRQMAVALRCPCATNDEDAPHLCDPTMPQRPAQPQQRSRQPRPRSMLTLPKQPASPTAPPPVPAATTRWRSTSADKNHRQLEALLRAICASTRKTDF